MQKNCSEIIGEAMIAHPAPMVFGLINVSIPNKIIP